MHLDVAHVRIHVGVFFDNLNGTDMEYTIRLRHDVGSRDTWQTARTAAAFNSPGPRIDPKYVNFMCSLDFPFYCEPVLYDTWGP